MSHPMKDVNGLYYKLDTIASGTTSAELDLEGGTLVNIITPSGISSTTFTITYSNVTGGTFVTLKNPDTGIAYTGVIAASGGYPIHPAITAGLRYIKIVYSASETAKTFKYGVRSID